MDVIRLLVELGIQSVIAHKRKSFIVGGLMAFGAFIVVLGTSLLDSVERSMRQSIVDSVTGDIQVYSRTAKDDLQIFGGFGMGNPDVGELPEYRKVRDALLKVDNVAAVVPMGAGAIATVSTPGDLDRALGSLRDAVRGHDDKAVDGGVATIKRLSAVLDHQRARRLEISNSKDNVEADAILARVRGDELWAPFREKDFQKESLLVLDELDSKLAPLGEEGLQIFMRLAGTDLDLFKQKFSKMKIIEGQAVPEHQRGMLIGQKFLDRRVKTPVAMNLDDIKDELAKGKTIEADQVLRETVQKEVRLSARILYMLGANDAPAVESALRAAGCTGGDLPALLRDFFNMNDANFAARYRLFYDVIAPKVQLYPFQVGDTITLTSFTNSGYLKSVNVKIYGTYAFEGLESSDLAGGLALVDMMTFRDSYGARTHELDKELAAMKRDVAAADIKREDVEAAMFGDESVASVVAEAKETAITGIDEGSVSTKEERQAMVVSAKFTQDDVDNGLALSAAVILKDPSKLWQTLGEINAVGEPMGLQAVDWQRAAGIVGQFIWVIRGVLTISILIIFAVAIVIINNSMVMATLERVAEIGTMRAIGARKGFVTLMIIFETAVLGIVAGTFGALVGAGVVTWLHSTGIAAPNDVLVFLFGGPKLFPFISVGNMVLALIATVVVSVAATLYPARLATRIQPVVAMQGKE